MRAALYARVSSTDQHADALVAALRDYASRQGWEAVEYVDEGVSGAKATRPALDALMDAVHRRHVDAVVVTKLDRLGRSVKHLCELVERFKAARVRLMVLDQAIDTETATGELLFHVLGAVAQFERTLIVERTKAGRFPRRPCES